MEQAGWMKQAGVKANRRTLAVVLALLLQPACQDPAATAAKPDAAPERARRCSDCCVTAVDPFTWFGKKKSDFPAPCLATWFDGGLTIHAGREVHDGKELPNARTEALGGCRIRANLMQLSEHLCKNKVLQLEVADPVFFCSADWDYVASLTESERSRLSTSVRATCRASKNVNRLEIEFGVDHPRSESPLSISIEVSTPEDPTKTPVPRQNRIH